MSYDEPVLSKDQQRKLFKRKEMPIETTCRCGHFNYDHAALAEKSLFDYPCHFCECKKFQVAQEQRQIKVIGRGKSEDGADSVTVIVSE